MDIKRFVRDHNGLMKVLASIYKVVFNSKIKGKKGLNKSLSGVFLNHTRIENNGINNSIKIGEGCRIYNSKISFYGNDNKVYIDNDCVLNNVNIWISDGGKIHIGHNSHFGGMHIACTEGKTVDIGEKCLFSDEIVIRTGDSHSIINFDNERINHAKDVYIGNHVWIGQHATILKGSNIGNDSVVGTQSLITGKTYPNNTIIAGSPAKVVRENINWDPNLI